MAKEAPKEMFKVTLHYSEWLRSKTQVIAHAGEDMEKEEHSSITGRIASPDIP
jgi:hypothetical protein